MSYLWPASPFLSVWSVLTVNVCLPYLLFITFYCRRCFLFLFGVRFFFPILFILPLMDKICINLEDILVLNLKRKKKLAYSKCAYHWMK